MLYPYFALCLFSAAAHSAQDNSFYYGLCILVSWALWPERSRRFALPVWLGVLAIAVVVGFFGQRGFGQLSRLAEEYDPQILSFLMHSLTDPKKSRTDIGDVGRVKMSGKIVIRLQPENGAHVPEYLREASYRKLSEFNYKSYKQLVWDSGNTNNDFPPVSETPPDSGIGLCMATRRIKTPLTLHVTSTALIATISILMGFFPCLRIAAGWRICGRILYIGTLWARFWPKVHD